MINPISAAGAVFKEVAEIQAIEASKLAVKELIEITSREAYHVYLSRLRESINATDMKNHPKLFEYIRIARENPDLRPSALNRILSNSEMKGQTGELLAEKILEDYGQVERQVMHLGVKPDLGIKELAKDLPLQSWSYIGGKLMQVSEVLRKGVSFGADVKNGVSELISNPRHVMEQMRSLIDKYGKAYLIVRPEDIADMLDNTLRYQKFLEMAAEENVKLIPLLPTQAQQVHLITSMVKGG